MRAAALAGALLVACGGGSSRGALRVEHAEPPAAVLAVDDGTGDRVRFDAGKVARVDPAGGVRWEVSYPATMMSWGVAGGELVLVGRETRKTTITRLDARSGMVLGAADSSDSIGRWLQRADALYHVDSYSIARVDAASGEDVWRVQGDFNEYEAQVAPRALWLHCGGAVCGFAADTGAQLATLPHANWPMLTPDGAALVLQAPDAADVYDAATGAKLWSVPVPATEVVNKTAVSDRWLAVLSDTRGSDVDHLRVFPRSGGAAVWSTASKPGTYLEYIAAGGDLVAYYRSSDAALHAVRLPDGAAAKVYQLRKTFVLSTDATGVAPAVPDGAPRIVDDVVLVSDFGKVHAFRVR